MLIAFGPDSDSGVLTARQLRAPSPSPGGQEVGSTATPVTKYVREASQLVSAVADAEAYKGHPTTIYVADDVSINLSPYNLPLKLGAGVTLMSGRKGVVGGAVLYTTRFDHGSLIDVVGNNVKVRGLRLRGPSGSPEKVPTVAAITVRINEARNVEITDNEIWNWTWSGVAVYGGADGKNPGRMTRAEARQIYVARNYIHDNVRNGHGYGVSASGGAHAIFEGNVFDNNRHAIASDGHDGAGYVARYNYVLEQGHCEPGSLGCYYNQHFDVHGSGDGGYGGEAGSYFDIAFNSFRGEQDYQVIRTRPALMVRGTPRDGVDFHDNVLVHSSWEAIRKDDGDLVISWDIDRIDTWSNHYETDPSTGLGMGDFDADGRQDVFLATGASWYYSSGAQAAWRFLSPNTTRIGGLRFGQFDSDSATDVFTQIGTTWFYSSGGKSAWRPLAAIGNYPLSSYRFGDFNGDGRTDVIRTDGTYWHVSWSARLDWEILKKTVYRDVRLGDFNGDGATDLFSLAGGNWSYAPGGSGSWEKLDDPLTTDLSALVFADFDGDGVTDIAQRHGGDWRYARGGRGGWLPLRTATSAGDFLLDLRRLLIADFDGRPGADALTYGFGNHFAIWSKRRGDEFVPSRFNRR
jgi:hypothetical protein